MIAINLVVEDTLSKNVVHAMLKHSGQDFFVNVVYDNGGNGYIRSKIKNFNQSARGSAYLVLTDLDTYACAPMLRAEWMAPATIHPNLIFRVAVKEVEAWLLADRQGFANFLGVRRDLVPENPELIQDPKGTLINLVAGCRKRKIKNAIVPDLATKAKQGPNYNGALSEYVVSSWNIEA